MKKLVKLDFHKISLKQSKPQIYYENEAIKIIKNLNTSDRNFKYFLRTIIKETRDSVEIEVWRDIVSEMQKYICYRINEEESDSSVLVPLRNKIKTTKRTYYDKFN